MKLGYFKVKIALSLLATSAVVIAAATVYWGYHENGIDGPSNWGALSPAFSACSEGSKQSPIKIDSYTTMKLEKIEFDYQNEKVKVVNNGHTIQFNTSGKSKIVVDGTKFSLVQFHFHTPAEHVIGSGAPADMVIHLVHKDNSGKLAVIAVLLKKSEKGKQLLDKLQKFWPKVKGPEISVDSVKYDPKDLLPKNTDDFFTYQGSLTTPGCNEIVTWLVLNHTSKVTAQTADKFTLEFGQNVRPLQDRNGRKILRNKD